MAISTTLKLEVAFSSTPYETLTGGDWTDISDRVLDFEMDRGRQDRTAEFEPGTIRVVLKNDDSELDPQVSGSLVDLAAGEGLPGCPVKVSTVKGGTTRTLFLGYLGPECWRVERAGPGIVSTSELQAVDTLGLFHQIAAPSSTYAAVLQRNSPDWWIRGLGGDVAAGNGDSLQDSSGNNYTSLIAASGSDVMFAADSLVPGDSDSAMRPQAGVSGYTDQSTLTDATSAFTMACIWKGGTSGSDQEIMRQRVVSGGVIRWRVVCSSSGQIVFTVYNTSGVAQAFTGSAASTYDDDQPHIIVASYQGSSYMRLRVDGNQTETTASIPATMTGRVIFGGGSAVADIDEVAYWESSTITTTVIAPDLEAAFDGTGPWATDGLDDRVDTWWKLAGEPGDPDNTGDPFEYHEGASDPLLRGAQSVPSSLGGAIEQIASWFRGATYALRSGIVRVRTYTALANASYAAKYVTPPLVNLTDEASPAGSPTPVRRSPPEWSGVRLDRVANVSAVSWGDLTFELLDNDSVALYGRRVRSWTSEVADALAASSLASTDAARYSDPTVELRAVRLDPGIDANAETFVVANLELEVPLDFTWTPSGGSSQSVAMNVQGESWRWANGTDWTVDLYLAQDVAT